MPDIPGADETPAPAEVSATPETGRERLVRALVRPARTQLVVAVLLALVGFAGIVQIRANEVDDQYAGLRDQDLIDILDGLAGTTQRTQSRIDDLQRTRAELQDDSSRRRAALEQAQQETDALNILAGLVPVTGPGIRVTITPGDGPVSVSSMLDALEELRSVGAEAIQVNGQVRLVAQSSIEQDGDGLVVDGVPLESPYTIDVIGIVNALAASMEFPYGPRKQLEDDGAEVEVQELTSLDIDAVREATPSEFAEPGPG